VRNMNGRTCALSLGLIVAFLCYSTPLSRLRCARAGEEPVPAGQEGEVLPVAFPATTSAQSIRPGEGGKVTVNFKNAPLQDLLQMVSERTGRRFVLRPEIREAVITAYLPDVPLNEALLVILAAHDLEMTEAAPGIALISRKDERPAGKEAAPIRTELIRLRHLIAEDVKGTLDPLCTDAGQIVVVRLSGHTGWVFGGDEETERYGSGFAPRERIEGEYRRQTASQLLLISDTPENLAFLKSVVEQIDLRPSQVLISANIVEVSRDKLRDIGFDWSASRSEGTFRYGAEVLNLEVEPGNFEPEAVMRGLTPFDAGGGLLLQRLGRHEFEMFIHALEEHADANILSAPQVLLLDNQEAVILVGTKFPILETNVSGTDVVQITTSLEYYENIGILLNVLPQVQDNEYVNMIVHPVVSDQTGSVLAQSTGGITLAEYPIIDIREMETQILIRDGQTIVIGGLFKDADTKSVLSVPLLGSIPLLGKLFQRTTVDTEKVELLIFLSASIVTEPGQSTAQKARNMARKHESQTAAAEPEPAEPVEGQAAQIDAAEGR